MLLCLLGSCGLLLSLGQDVMGIAGGVRFFAMVAGCKQHTIVQFDRPNRFR